MTVLIPVAEPPRDIATASSEDESIAFDLFDLQLRFNLFPATYAHCSWIERLGFCELMNDRTALPLQSTFWIRSVSDALLTEHGLDRQFDLDFSAPRKRIALLEAQVALAIARHVAAILLREHLRTVVTRAAVAEIRAKIGADAHRFALQFDTAVPYLPALLSRLTACPAADWDRLMSALVIACLPDGAFGVLGRMQLRFPHAWTDAAVECQLRESERAQLGKLFIWVARHIPIAAPRLFEVTRPARSAHDRPDVLA